MKTITLKRVSFDDDGTYGVLIYERVPFLLTLERPWRDNAKGISSIPESLSGYIVKRDSTEKHPRTFRVLDVAGRDGILIHTGNTEKDVEGCIIPGLQFGRIDTVDPDTQEVASQPAVLQSTAAFALLDKFIGSDEQFRLIVKW